MKKCGKCNKEKSLQDFGTYKRSPDGRQSYCKNCMTRYMYDYVRARMLNKPQEVPTSKICLGCKRDLPISQFGVRRASKDHLQQYCKPCWRILVKNSIRKKANAR